jgi:hypothetical protein
METIPKRGRRLWLRNWSIALGLDAAVIVLVAVATVLPNPTFAFDPCEGWTLWAVAIPVVLAGAAAVFALGSPYPARGFVARGACVMSVLTFVASVMILALNFLPRCNA